MVLDASLLNTQHYMVGSRVKWNYPGKGVTTPTPHFGVVVNEKRTFELPSTMVANFIY